MIELFLDCERFSLSQHEAFRILNLGVVFADICSFFAAFDKKQVLDLANGGYLKMASLIGNRMIQVYTAQSFVTSQPLK